MRVCLYCQRLVIWGSDVCPRCASTAVSSEADARRLMRAAQSWLRSQGLSFSKPDLPLRVRTARELGSLRGSACPAGKTLGLTRVRWVRLPGLWLSATVEEISILGGLPRHLFESTCVHELGHAWLADRRVRPLSRIEEEGFCQLLQARWLARLPTPEARNQLASIQNSDDPVYGAGFRTMCARAASMGGFSRFVESLRDCAMASPPILVDWRRKIARWLT